MRLSYGNARQHLQTSCEGFKLLYCIMEDTEDIMRDNMMKEDFQGEETMEVNQDEEKT